MNVLIRNAYSYQKKSFSNITLLSKSGSILKSLNENSIKINEHIPKIKH